MQLQPLEALICRATRLTVGLAVLVCVAAAGGCDGQVGGREGAGAAAPTRQAAPTTTAGEADGAGYAGTGEALFPALDPTTEARSGDLVIAHTNDLHGQVQSLPALWIREEDPPQAGGLEALAAELERARAAASAAGAGFLYVDSGDSWQGTPEGDVDAGRVVRAWLAAQKIDALGLGEHDFDAGPAALAAGFAQTPLPVTCANLLELDSGARPPFAQGTILREVGGLKVAIVGLIDDDTKSLSSARATAGLDFRDEHEACRREVRSAREAGADVVVVLSHCGPAVDRELAAQVEGIDVIVGGRSHRAHHEVDLQHGTLLHATYSKGTTLGLVRLRVERGQVVHRAAELVQVMAGPEREHAATRALVAEEVAELAAAMDEVLGRADAPLRRAPGFASSGIGSWTADLMRAEVGADLAIHNKAGIRADLAAGPIRARDLYQISPFGNELVVVHLTGAELRDELEYALSDPDYAIELSGGRVRFALDRPAGRRIVHVTVGGEPLDRARQYKVVTNSFLGKGGRGHRRLATRREWRRIHTQVLELQRRDVVKRGDLTVPDEPRIAPAETTMPE